MLNHGLASCIHCLVQRVECLIYRRTSRRICEGLVKKISCTNAMGWAHLDVTIPIQLALRNVATRTLAICFSLALDGLVLLGLVSIQPVFSSKLHGTIITLPRRRILVHIAQVGGELNVCLEFDLANLARYFVGLAGRNVHVFGVGCSLFENLPTVRAHQGAALSACLHLRSASEFLITKGAAAWLRLGGE